MTDLGSLRPSDAVAVAVCLEGTNDEETILGVYTAIGPLYDWPSVDEWSVGLTRPGRYHYLVLVDGRVAGLVKFIDGGAEGLELNNFGLIAEFIGRGIGGAALTAAVREGWRAFPTCQRIWLHTSISDHPHALPNYLARGFAIFDPESRADQRSLACAESCASRMRTV